MNNQTKWRTDLARKFATAAEDTPGLKAMAIGGSVARGLADEYSDLELSVFWDEVPNVEERKKWLARLDLLPVEVKPLQKSELALLDDTHLYHGFQVDIWHCDLRTTEKILSDVLTQFDPTPSKATFVENIVGCIPLLNEAQLGLWKRQAGVLPKELAIKIVSENLKYLGYHNFSTYLARNEVGILLGLFSGIQKRAFNIVLALNGRHFSSYKRMEEMVSGLEIAPLSWMNGLSEIYKLPLVEAVAALEKTMRETIALVQRHLPEVDTKKVVHDLDHPVRKPFSEPPQAF